MLWVLQRAHTKPGKAVEHEGGRASEREFWGVWVMRCDDRSDRDTPSEAGQPRVRGGPANVRTQRRRKSGPLVGPEISAPGPPRVRDFADWHSLEPVEVFLSTMAIAKPAEGDRVHRPSPLLID